MYWCVGDDRNYVKPFRVTLSKVREEMPKDYTIEEIKGYLSSCLPFCLFLLGQGQELRDSVAEYIDFFNNRRPHQKFSYHTPSQVESDYYEA